MSTILVTGANGQLGSTFKKISNFYPMFNFIFTDVEELDITIPGNIDLFLEKHTPSCVVNCAGYTNVDKAEDEQELAYLLNSTAVSNLSEATKKQKTRLIHISTDYVFGSEKNTPYTESDETYSESVYGKSKASGEKKIKDENHIIILRTSWLYSNFQKNFYKTILRLSEERDELNVVYDQIGSPTFAGDLARAVMKILIHTEETNEFHNGIYHFSNEGVASWYDFAVEINRLANNKCTINPIESFEFPQKAKRPFYSLMNKKKIRNVYKVETPHWRESLCACMKERSYSK